MYFKYILVNLCFTRVLSLFINVVFLANLIMHSSHYKEHCYALDDSNIREATPLKRYLDSLKGTKEKFHGNLQRFLLFSKTETM